MELFWNFFPGWRRTDETADKLKNYVYGFPARVRVFGSQKSVFKVDVGKSCHCKICFKSQTARRLHSRTLRGFVGFHLRAPDPAITEHLLLVGGTQIYEMYGVGTIHTTPLFAHEADHEWLR